MVRSVNLHNAFIELREQVGDIDIDCEEDVTRIIDKYKEMAADSYGSADQLVNMSLIEDRQQVIDLTSSLLVGLDLPGSVNVK